MRLQRRVLDDPQKELRELYNTGLCDLYFEFEPKTYKSKEAQNRLLSIYRPPFKVFKNDKGYVKRVVNAIQLHLEIAVQVAQKIQKKFEQYIDKPAKQIGAIIRVCLMEDFGIE